MTVEVAVDEAQKQQEEQDNDVEIEEGEAKAVVVEKSSSYREESNFLSDLRESERKALTELKSMLQDDNNNNNNNDDANVSIWGVPLLPAKCSQGTGTGTGTETDVVLLKFLRAREFRVTESYQMLKKTLAWRRQHFKITEEDHDPGLALEELGMRSASAAYMSGTDRENHPVCYNIFGVFSDHKLYQNVFGSEAQRETFLRWRIQLMESSLQKLDFRPTGSSSILQVYDLRNCPGPFKTEIRIDTFKAIALLQDNYPELVAKNVLINVPFWYYAFYSLISPFLTQRSKSKFVVARPSKVTETLLKYIPFEEIPIQYGGLKRENDVEFDGEENGKVTEIVLKPGCVETIEIPALEVGKTLIWDFAVLGGEVTYKEEFVPSDEGSYTIIIQKDKKMESMDKPVRNSFRNNEVGKVVVTINNQSKKKKRAFYRYKN
ncbi:hypothetical protein vseg_001524 [Gypsophila vaccaria]